MSIIRINLLPPEKRRRERTPLSRFVALIVGTAVNAAIVLFMVKTALDTRSLVQQKTDIEGRIVTTKKKVEPEYDKTKKDVEKIAARKNAIDGLKKEKILSWSEVVDSICDVLAANQWVWLTGVDLGEGKKASGATQLDLYAALSCSSSASEEDCKKDRVGEVMTKFKRDLWDKFKVGPGTDVQAKERKFPFDWADENFPINRKDNEKWREFVELNFTATVGRKMAAAKSGAIPGKK